MRFFHFALSYCDGSSLRDLQLSGVRGKGFCARPKHTFGRADSRTTGTAQWREGMKIYPGTSIFREDLSGAGRKNGPSVTVIRRRSYVRAGRQPNDGSSAMARRNEIYPGTSIFREDLSGAGRKNGPSVTVIRRHSYVRAGRQPNNGNSAMARRNENISRYKYILRRLIRCGQIVGGFVPER